MSINWIALQINKQVGRIWHQFFVIHPQSRQFVRGVDVEAATWSRWQAVQEGTQSQVLQGFLSLLCVHIISVGICPLAKGLMDVRGSLRVGQALLVPGEKAKPFGREKRKTKKEVSVRPVQFYFLLPMLGHTGTNTEGAEPFSTWGMHTADV